MQDKVELTNKGRLESWRTEVQRVERVKVKLEQANDLVGLIRKVEVVENSGENLGLPRISSSVTYMCLSDNYLSQRIDNTLILK